MFPQRGLDFFFVVTISSLIISFLVTIHIFVLQIDMYHVYYGMQVQQPA